MGVIANITSFPGTAGIDLATADAGWVKSTTAPFGTLPITLDGASRATNSATAGNSAGYLRTETPGSKNQTVRAGMVYPTTKGTDNYPLVLARVNGNSWIGVYFVGSANLVYLAKSVSGARSTVTTAAHAITVGVEYEVELQVSGSAPNIIAKVFVDGVEKISQTLTEAALDTIGSVGIHTRWASTGGDIRFTSFYAEDDTSAGSPPAGTVTIGAITPGETTAQVTYSYSAADETGYEYRIDGGTAASIGASPATITGLTASTEYDIEVRAINAIDAGAWSAVSTFTTASAGDTTAPTLTGDVTFSAITTSGYTATWPAGADNVAVTGYEYQIGSTAGTWIDAGDVLSVAITWRTAGATETFYVRAYDAAGYRSTPAISGEVTVLTPSAYGTITIGSALYPIRSAGGSPMDESGVRVCVVNALTMAPAYYGAGHTIVDGVMTISEDGIVAGTEYNVVVKIASDWKGVSDEVTAT